MDELSGVIAFLAPFVIIIMTYMQATHLSGII